MMRTIQMAPVAERFIRYAKIPTQSDPASDTCPSTKGQWKLARLLHDELIALGCTDVTLDAHGYVTATVGSNIEKSVPVIGFIAHMDTSPDFSGTGVNPILVSRYDGGPILLNARKKIWLDPSEFPELLHYQGEDLIVTDGTTLLGADDKAGIAEIMEAISWLIQHPEIPHGTIKIGFTPDEEIGRGADLFKVNAFGAEFAFTLDGGPLGELEFENFNAASATLTIQGRNVHPGTAKKKMINAMQVGMDLHHLLPWFERPEHTEGFEGFFHLIRFNGTVDQAQMEYIIRDHHLNRFEERKRVLLKAVEGINKKYPENTVHIMISDQYFNMREKIEPVYHIIELAHKAMMLAKVNPVIKPIRGGTDGARLSYMGLPTPNIFTGGHNFHGRYEFIPISSMEKAIVVIVNIVRLAAG